MYNTIAPYSYGLAARAPRIYNNGACSGGQGVRSSRRMLPLEATRPGLLGTPGLVTSLSQRRCCSQVGCISKAHGDRSIVRSARRAVRLWRSPGPTQHPLDDAGRRVAKPTPCSPASHRESNTGVGDNASSHADCGRCRPGQRTQALNSSISEISARFALVWFHLRLRGPTPAPITTIKIVMDQRRFKFPLS